MNFATLFSALIVVCATATSSKAADICEGIFVQDTGAIDAPESVVRKGQRQYAITQYRVDGEQKSYCSHGGYCYPAQTLRLTNCKIDFATKHVSDGTAYYELSPVRSRISPDRLRRDDIENQLLEIGMCSACARNAALSYVRRPKSKCGLLVRRALEGNPVARDQLANDNLCS